MPKPNKTVHAAFEKANKVGDLPAAVQLARQTLAAQLIIGVVIDDSGALINLLRGERQRANLSAEDAFDEQGADLFAVLAMGIALGQLVHADVFRNEGGAR